MVEERNSGVASLSSRSKLCCLLALLPCSAPFSSIVQPFLHRRCLSLSASTRVQLLQSRPEYGLFGGKPLPCSVSLCSQSQVTAQSSSSESKSSSDGSSSSSSSFSSEALNPRLHQLVQELEHSGKIELAHEAEALLSEYSDRSNTKSHNLVISCWTKAAAKFASQKAVVPIDGNLHSVMNGKDAAVRAQTLLEQMEAAYMAKKGPTPDTTSYNTAIDAWSKSKAKDAAPKAIKLLKRMIRLSTEGNLPDSPQPWSQISPDVITFNTVLDALAQHPSPDAIQTADSLLDTMQQLNLQPNTNTYNNVIHVYSRSRADAQVVQKAISYLNDLQQQFNTTLNQDLQPDVTTYTSIIDCISRSSHPKKGTLAQQIFTEMEALYNTTHDAHVKPNVRTYTAVINALAWSNEKDAAQRAELVLAKMESHHDGHVKPNVRTYTAVISCWARSHDVTKPQRALKILKRMKDLHHQQQQQQQQQHSNSKHNDEDPSTESIKPNLYTYNAVIDACARCQSIKNAKQQGEALKIAFAVFKSLKQSHITPNHITYGSLIKATENLMPPGKERYDVVKAVFENCKKDGMVDEAVLRQLRQAADLGLFLELVGGDNPVVDYMSLPRDWMRNVV